MFICICSFFTFFLGSKNITDLSSLAAFTSGVGGNFSSENSLCSYTLVHTFNEAIMCFIVVASSDIVPCIVLQRPCNVGMLIEAMLGWVAEVRGGIFCVMSLLSMDNDGNVLDCCFSAIKSVDNVLSDGRFCHAKNSFSFSSPTVYLSRTFSL